MSGGDGCYDFQLRGINNANLAFRGSAGDKKLFVIRRKRQTQRRFRHGDGIQNLPARGIETQDAIGRGAGHIKHFAVGRPRQR